MSSRIVIIGAGGHGLIVAGILLASRAHDSQAPEVVGILDDNPALTGTRMLDVPILGPMKLLADIPHDGVIVAIGDNHRRERLANELLQRGERLIVARHPHASVDPDAEIGPGCSISAGVVITPGARLGTGVIINTNTSIDHGNAIDDFAHVSAGVALGGNVTIGARTLIGLGASIAPGRCIGADAIIGVGAVVVHDIPDGVVAYGVPARIHRHVAAAKD